MDLVNAIATYENIISSLDSTTANTVTQIMAINAMKQIYRIKAGSYCMGAPTPPLPALELYKASQHASWLFSLIHFSGARQYSLKLGRIFAGRTSPEDTAWLDEVGISAQELYMDTDSPQAARSLETACLRGGYSDYAAYRMDARLFAGGLIRAKKYIAQCPEAEALLTWAENAAFL